MCGIYGAIGDYEPDKSKLLLLLNENRGRESTGIYFQNKIVKDKISAKEFLLNHLDIFNSQHKYILGHTRQATTGKVEKENAHPFQIGRIIGSHNGIINNFETLQKKYNTSFEVDSQIIFYLLDTKGIEGLKELDGTFAIWYIDQTKPYELNLLQHYSELAVATARHCLYFTSDKRHLKITLSKKHNIFNLKQNRLYTININTLTITKQKLSLPKYERFYYRGYLHDIYEYDDYKYAGYNYNKKFNTYYANDVKDDYIDESNFLYCEQCEEFFHKLDVIHNVRDGKLYCIYCDMELTQVSDYDEESIDYDKLKEIIRERSKDERRQLLLQDLSKE